MDMHLRFFEPNKEMIKWLQSYIGNRIPIDVGAGYCDLLCEINKGGIGIDPFTDITFDEKLELSEKGIYHIPLKVEMCESMITGLKEKGIMIIARPCHSTFIENAIDLAPEGMEVLYITKPENLIRYNDLGKYDDQKVLISHKGEGTENEVVYSIVKK